MSSPEIINTPQPHPLAGREILFTRQRHEAKRAGLHWDYRLVLGDKAYSWATKKELPPPGGAIILFEQPVHDRGYALSKVVEIPEGSYGHGTTTLDWVRKAKVAPETEEDKLVIHSGDERFLLKKLDPIKYGEKSWLFKNLSAEKFTRQKLAAVNPELEAKFKPDLTPDQMARLGVLRFKGSGYGEGDPTKDNFFKVDASLKTWPEKWHNEAHPLGWYEWFQNYHAGKRTPDDERQIKRWISFKARHLAQLQKADPTLEDLSVQPRRRQALLNWGIAPGDKNKYLTKIAKTAKQDERPHVAEAARKLEENRGLILHWGTGSGKSKFFLDSAKKALDENKKDDALIVAPASLTTNIDKELKKHNIKLDRKRLQVYSYEKANNISDELSKKKFSIAIADEAHKLRNHKTQRTQSLTDIFQKADKKILSTATANYHSASDIAPLLNIAAGYDALPVEKKKFENRYIRKVNKPQGLADRILNKTPEQREVLTRREELGNLFKDHVHYYDPKDDPKAKDKFPTMNEKVVEVEMSPEQQKYYKFVEGKIPFWIRMKIRHNLPLDKQEKSQFNHFSQGVRQVSNSHRHLTQDGDSAEFTPKITKAVESLKRSMNSDKNFRGVVYSNYLDSGLHEYSRALKKHGIKHEIYHGGLSREEKDKIRDQYNSGKLNTLLISSSGAEGLDLKGTKKVQVLEPHFNKAKVQQVLGRASRYESHSHLPKEERVVEAEHYLSVHPKDMFGHAPTSIDKYLKFNSDDKDEVFSQIRDIMKANS